MTGIALGGSERAETKPRPLLAWEHGFNLGHAACLSELGRRFTDAGLQVALALPEHGMKSTLFNGLPYPRFCSPRIQTPTPRRPSKVHSFADILAHLGFTDAPALQVGVTAWLDLFSKCGANAVVLDYAPAAQLAALIAGLPAVQVTNGFAAPPSDCPTFGDGLRGPWAERRNADVLLQIDAALNAAGRAFGVRNLSLKALFAYPRRWYDCIEQTDPYGPRDDGVYLGSIGRPPAAQVVPWPEGPAEAPKVFAYLRSEQQVRAVVGALRQMGSRSIVVWADAREKEALAFQTPSVRIVTRPVDLGAVLPSCDAVINYGSTNLVCRAFVARKPQLMLPTDTEKWLVARRAAMSGSSAVLPDQSSSVEIQEALARHVLKGEACAFWSDAAVPSEECLSRRLENEIMNLKSVLQHCYLRLR